MGTAAAMSRWISSRILARSPSRFSARLSVSPGSVLRSYSSSRGAWMYFQSPMRSDAISLHP